MGKIFNIYYWERYGQMYQVEAPNYEEAEKRLTEDIREGRRDGPDECRGCGYYLSSVEEEK